MAEIVRFTDFMIGILDALSTKPDVAMGTEEIAKIISDDPEMPPTNLIRVTPSQLVGPMNRLRATKWVRRIKTKIGEKQVGNAYYPMIQRTYELQDGKLELWREVRKLIDAKGGIDSAELQRAVEDIAERKAEDTLAEFKGEPSAPYALAHAVAQIAEETKAEVAETHVRPPEDDSWKDHHERFFKLHTIMDREVRGNKPYMTRLIIGRLRFHIFHRGDLDADPHDHPWNFWTFPLRSYVEEVAIPVGGYIGGPRSGESNFEIRRFVVERFRWHFRPAEHRHRVIGHYAGYVQGPSLDNLPDGLFKTMTPAEANALMASDSRYLAVADDKKIATIVWRGPMRRTWGFWKSRAGRWCWQKFDKYIWEGGKNQPCGD